MWVRTLIPVLIACTDIAYAGVALTEPSAEVCDAELTAQLDARGNCSPALASIAHGLAGAPASHVAVTPRLGAVARRDFTGMV
jgi:hypothetical protein